MEDVDLDAKATALTGIPLVRMFDIVSGDGTDVTTSDEWGDESTWERISESVQVNEVQARNRRLIVSRSAQRTEIPVISNHRPSAAATEAEYEGTVPDGAEDLAEDEDMVPLTTQNAVEAEAGTKASVIVRLPDGSTEDALTWVEAALNNGFTPLDTARTSLDEVSALKIRTWLAQLFINGTYVTNENGKSVWERHNVLTVGVNATVTGHFTAEGWHDTSLLNTPHIAWITLPANHILASKGQRGALVQFMPTSLTFHEKSGRWFPKLDRSSVVGYRKFDTVDDLTEHQDVTVAALAAVRRATTAVAQRAERDSEESADERAAAQF